MVDRIENILLQPQITSKYLDIEPTYWTSCIILGGVFDTIFISVSAIFCVEKSTNTLRHFMYQNVTLWQDIQLGSKNIYWKNCCLR